MYLQRRNLARNMNIEILFFYPSLRAVVCLFCFCLLLCFVLLLFFVLQGCKSRERISHQKRKVWEMKEKKSFTQDACWGLHNVSKLFVVLSHRNRDRDYYYSNSCWQSSCVDSCVFWMGKDVAVIHEAVIDNFRQARLAPSGCLASWWQSREPIVVIVLRI